MRRKAAAIFISTVVAIGLISMLAWGLLVKVPATGLSGIALVGKPAPDFTLSLFDGRTLILSQHRGQPVVLNFWASWCAPCRVEAPILEKQWQEYKDKGVLFVGIDIQDTEMDALAYIQEFNITYPNGTDERGHITVDYGVSGIPITFILDRSGTIVHRWVGNVSEPRLAAWIDGVVAGAPPTGEADVENPGGFFQIGQ